MDDYREEEVTIKLTFDADKLTEEDIAKINRILPYTMKPGDKIHLTYDFYVWYQGVVAKFNAIIDLLDKALIVEVNTKELRYNRFLIQELLCNLEQIERKYTKEK